MTAKASPRPWRLEDGFECEIVDATGRHVLTASSKYAIPPLGDEREAANAALIVDAVNERDRLRDLVKRMIPFVEKCHSDALDLSKTIKGICALKGVDTSEIDRINSEHDALIAEARAAIGEAAP